MISSIEIKTILVLFMLSISQIAVSKNYQTEKVDDGKLVLVKHGKELVAFMLHNQTISPEGARYDWSLYELKSLKLIETGSGKTGDSKIWILPLTKQNPINIGKTKLYWSGNRKGRGFVYFNYYPSSVNLEYCLSEYSEFSDIDKALEECQFTAIK